MKVNIISLSEIEVPAERQRSEIPDKHVAELVESILTDGLINPLVVDEQNRLVAGNCRLCALQAIAEQEKPYYFAGSIVGPGQAPVTVTHQTDDKALYRIELEENIRRLDLSPIDRAAAIAKLHNMRVSENPAHTQRDTAQELAEIENHPSPGSKEVEVSEALILSQFQDDPDVRKAKTKSAALKIAKTKMQNEFLQSLGVAADATDSEHTVYEGDCLEVMRGFEAHSFDGIVCDPPYGVSADSFGEQSFSLGHGYADSEEAALSLIRDLLSEGTRILRPSSAVYLFCDIRLWPRLADLARDAEYYVWPTPLIWYKGTTGHCPRPGFGPKRVYEAILFATRGDKPTISTGCDVISCQPVRAKRHAAEKPVGLLEELLSWSFTPGDTILDPTAGSGSIIPAAQRAGIRATCIERDPKFAALCKQRLTEKEEAEDGSNSVDLASLFG